MNQTTDFHLAKDATSASSVSAEDHIPDPGSTYILRHEIPVMITGSESIKEYQAKYDIFVVTPAAENYLDNESNQSQLKQLNTLRKLMLSVVSGYDPDLPKARISLAEDNSITLSWRFGKAYFGASIFDDESESIWTLISGGGNMRGYASDGYLNDPEFEIQLPTMFDLLRKYQNR